MKKYDLLNYVINSFIDDFYPKNPPLTPQQLIEKEEAAQAARRSFQYIMGGVFFADTIEEIPVFGKILALVFEAVKSMMGVLGGLSATLLPLPFGVLPFGSFIGAFVGWLVSMIFFLPYAAMSFSQKQFSDTAVGLFSMIPIVGIPIANMFKSGLKSGSKIYYLSSKATEEVMALFEKIRSVAQTATSHSFAPGNLREKLLKTAKKLQEQARLLVREQPSLESQVGAIYPKTPAPPVETGEHTNPFGPAPPPSAPPANAVQPPPQTRPNVPQTLIPASNAASVFGPGRQSTVPQGTTMQSNPAQTNGRPRRYSTGNAFDTYKRKLGGGKRFTRRHAIRRKCRTVKHRPSRKH